MVDRHFNHFQLIVCLLARNSVSLTEHRDDFKMLYS